MRVGVMLAAGEASRLPNKPLLPTRDRNSIVIESGLRLLSASGCGRLVVVERKDSLLRHVLHRRRWLCEHLTQTNNGVVGAILQAADICSDEDELIVTFCDNIHPHGSRVPLWKSEGRRASVRQVSNAQLDVWSDDMGKWADRSQKKEGDWSFAGWLAVPATALRDAQEDVSMVSLLNYLEFDPVQLNDGTAWHGTAWHDVGTVESYEEYIKS